MSKLGADLTKPDFLFEVSWEVCNKVGGIHTVISTKAITITERLKNNYILIGPDLDPKNDNPEFQEDVKMLKTWRNSLIAKGYNVKIGRWKVPGSPVVVLLDFKSAFEEKDEILKFLWDNYKVDSLTGGWDYIEPVVFGYAAAKLIEDFYATHCTPSSKIVAHFHEWMTGSGGLYLQQITPNIATVFTTHATILGRSLAGNGEPLYRNLSKFNAEKFASRYNIMSKYTLERASAKYFDCFATVSDITARESLYLLGEEVDMVTPNGFEDDFVWKGEEGIEKRRVAREKMIKVAELCLDHKFKSEPLIIGTSGRYEYKNKGLDVLLESLKSIADSDKLGREVLAYITVPAGNNGARVDLKARLEDGKTPIDRSQYPHTTHYLSGWDPIVESMEGSILRDPKSKVKIIFVPTYLNGQDGIFNVQYYELLVGMDLTVYASYYEPWGYTPLESVAFSVPTVTTTLAGFGAWVDGNMGRQKGAEVISRTDNNDEEVIREIADTIVEFSVKNIEELNLARKSAHDISKTALWENLIEYYDRAYSIAIHNSFKRVKKESRIESRGGAQEEQLSYIREQLKREEPTWTRLMITSNLPKRLAALEKLSRNLWWCWNDDAKSLFEYIDEKLWLKCKKNPIALLEKVDYSRLEELENDKKFITMMDRVHSEFETYMSEPKDSKEPKTAYFCMEYGLHSSLKIYSGGLGILAGDYLKEASDKNVPLVAVGLLYRYGYFTQKLSAQGEQEASYEPQNFHKLPITPARDDNGNWVSVSFAFPGRTVTARVWLCMVGRTKLYLLDTDHDLNFDEDRSMTHHLYGGDWENRLKQELLLGIGGVRALNKMGIRQEVFHCNEGHASMLGFERIRTLINEQGLTFSEALEVVRSSSLFTTHTPVPAGHDAFEEGMMRKYIGHYPERLGISWDQIMTLGRSNPDNRDEKFSMSFLACNLSQEINGVSWLHGEVSKDILGVMWPGYFKDELSVSYVTNGVHFPTWIAPNMRKLYEKYFPEGFNSKSYNIEAWQSAFKIGDKELWDERMVLKNALIEHIRERMNDPQQMLFASPNQIVKTVDALQPDTLTIGFARRFATYKRANLLFANIDRLNQIVNNPDRPVRFVFAGKAHPNDKPGQDLIKRIIEISAMPQFAGKIIFLQDYDMELASKMVQGVDVWLNTPTRPLEASGTSGQKCVMNGVLQFSVLDGWWVEGYKEGAGWMLPIEQAYEDHNHQDQLDAEMIYNTIEDEIATKYYDRDSKGLPVEWLKFVKSCIANIASEFTTNRMFRDYEDRFYHNLHKCHKTMIAEDFKVARELSAWKNHVGSSWNSISVLEVNKGYLERGFISADEESPVSVELDTNGIDPNDIGVELVIAEQINNPNRRDVVIKIKEELTLVSNEDGRATYSLDDAKKIAGSFDIAIRIYPKHPALAHRMDLALVKWA